MESLRSLIGANRVPDSVDDDDVYPTTLLDNHPGCKDTILAWTLRFNDVLDADKLHDALSRLLEIGDWRRLGGRLRPGKDARLELHVPKVFTQQRPAVNYTRQVFDVRLSEHPLAKDLQRPTEGPSVQHGADKFRLFAARAGVPTKLADFINQDVSQLSLHITSFSDETLVALSWNHATMDGQAQRALLHAWSLVLADQKVPPVLSAREDVLYNAVSPSLAPEEDFLLESLLLKGFSFFLFVLYFLWDILWDRTVEARTVYLPKEAIAKLQSQALPELSTDAAGGTKPWVSEGDVILAWATRMVACSQTRPRPVNIMSFVNVRPRLPEIVKPGGVYIQNMITATQTLLSAEAARGPIGRIALAHRQTLIAQATRAQLLAFLRTTRRLWDQGGTGVVLCMPPDAVLLSITNWTKADFIHAVDFGPAVVRQGEGDDTRANPLGTMVYHHVQPLGSPSPTKNAMAICGKDHHGNYWLSGFFSLRTWAMMEANLKALSPKD